MSHELNELTLFAWGMVTSVEGQVMFWGMLTSTAFILALVSWLTQTADDCHGQRLVAAGLITICWTVNNLMWVTANLEKMFFTDLFFTAMALTIWRGSRQWWSLALAIFYGVCVVLDVCLIKQRISADSFAWSSNIIYVLQLLAVSGLIKEKPPKVRDGLYTTWFLRKPDGTKGLYFWVK